MSFKAVVPAASHTWQDVFLKTSRLFKGWHVAPAPSFRKHLYSPASLWLSGLCSPVFCRFFFTLPALHVKRSLMVTHFTWKHTNVFLLNKRLRERNKKKTFSSFLPPPTSSSELTAVVVAHVIALHGLLVHWRLLTSRPLLQMFTASDCRQETTHQMDLRCRFALG